MASDLGERALQRVKEEKGLLEKILMVIPGYRGYKKKELLRETDRLVRDTLYRKMRMVVSNFREAFRDLVNMDSGEVKSIERVVNKAERVTERIHHAEYGYSPYMSAIKVDDAELLSLLRFDSQLTDKIAELTRKSEELRTQITSGNERIGSTIAEGEALVDDFDHAFNTRKEHMLMLVEGGR